MWREAGFMTLDVSISDGIAVVTLNRPDVLNAINTEMRGRLKETWRRIADDDDILVAILTGAGNRAFCVGTDLKSAAAPQRGEAAVAFGGGESDHLLAGLDTDKPIICAINGYAVGGGLEIALAADIRIAVPHAEFGLTEAKVGSIPGAGGTQRLPRLVGRSIAMQMMLTAELIDADVALRCGLVSEIVPSEELIDRARELAGAVAQNAPLSVRAIKRLVTRGESMPLDAGLEAERFVWGLLRDSADRQEGGDAFREKRQPRFRGE
jgi:E-phenylitaconyl-CoA hydratase